METQSSSYWTHGSVEVTGSPDQELLWNGRCSRLSKGQMDRIQCGQFRELGAGSCSKKRAVSRSDAGTRKPYSWNLLPLEAFSRPPSNLYRGAPGCRTRRDIWFCFAKTGQGGRRWLGLVEKPSASTIWVRSLVHSFPGRRNGWRTPTIETECGRATQSGSAFRVALNQTLYVRST